MKARRKRHERPLKHRTIDGGRQRQADLGAASENRQPTSDLGAASENRPHDGKSRPTSLPISASLNSSGEAQSARGFRDGHVCDRQPRLSLQSNSHSFVSVGGTRAHMPPSLHPSIPNDEPVEAFPIPLTDERLGLSTEQPRKGSPLAEAGEEEECEANHKFLKVGHVEVLHGVREGEDGEE
ncbi:hypothetical protein Ancab_019825 [Ancistrocladus abbreviatus]